jgi:hypothetical protein
MGLKATHHVPTPTASDHIVRTPTVEEKNSRFNPHSNKAVTLNRWVGMFPTPTSVDAKRGAYTYDPGEKPKRARLSLLGAARTGWMGDQRDVEAIERAKELEGWLNPPWVEWLMGYPTGWTG